MAGDPPPYSWNDWFRGCVPVPMISLPSPKFVPVNVQVPDYGVTVVTLDKDGNLTVKVNHLPPEPTAT